MASYGPDLTFEVECIIAIGQAGISEIPKLDCMTIILVDQECGNALYDEIGDAANQPGKGFGGKKRNSCGVARLTANQTRQPLSRGAFDFFMKAIRVVNAPVCAAHGIVIVIRM